MLEKLGINTAIEKLSKEVENEIKDQKYQLFLVLEYANYC